MLVRLSYCHVGGNGGASAFHWYALYRSVGHSDLRPPEQRTVTVFVSSDEVAPARWTGQVWPVGGRTGFLPVGVQTGFTLFFHPFMYFSEDWRFPLSPSVINLCKKIKYTNSYFRQY